MTTISKPDLNTFTRAYLECALWSSTDPDDDAPLDQHYDLGDFADEALATAIADCAAFQTVAYAATDDPMVYSPRAGRDFWLTRNHHGAGFWDGDWGEGGDVLTEIAHRFPEIDLYPGDDGQLHFS